MTVVLNPHTEAIVAEHLKKGRYATPDEAVNALIANQEADGGLEYDQVRAELLSTVGKPNHPYRKGQFSEAG
ncbi:MAG TPA: hypothetical protein VGO11_06295 [Chthoniobacteraceae bacterium]|jgi:Arc/MetJ-type ribon-helix-helix transcriptional regulator|nr:hypothetical protein [Chthoniobacteraceae bacterium]